VVAETAFVARMLFFPLSCAMQFAPGKPVRSDIFSFNCNPALPLIVPFTQAFFTPVFGS